MDGCWKGRDKSRVEETFKASELSFETFFSTRVAKVSNVSFPGVHLIKTIQSPSMTDFVCKKKAVYSINVRKCNLNFHKLFK